MAESGGNRGIQGFREVDVRMCLRQGGSWFAGEPVNTPSEAVRRMGGVLMQMDREVVCAVNLDSKLKPLSYNVISVGGLDRALVPVNNIFKSAVLSNAAGIILLHNHPSGDVTPSEQDRLLTEKVVKAGRIMDIPVRDHIVVGSLSGGMYSFRANMPQLFSEQSEEGVQHTGERDDVHYDGPGRDSEVQNEKNRKRRERDWERN